MVTAVVAQACFDYSVVDADARDDVRDAAVRIKVRMARTATDIIEIGRDLIAVKRALEHGQFQGWLNAEFGMSDQSARNFMNVADRFGDKTPMVGDLAPAALYALAAPSTPSEVVQQVVERSSEGERFTAAQIKVLKDEWAAERRELRSSLDRAKSAKAQAEGNREEYEQQAARARAELAEARDQLDTLEHELARKSATVADLRQPLEDAYPQWAAIMDSLWAMGTPEWHSRWVDKQKSRAA